MKSAMVFSLLFGVLSCTPKAPPSPVHVPLIGIPLEGLSAVQLSWLSKLLNTEICPCTECAQSFAECLPKCKPARLLATWATDRLREGVPPEAMQSAISQEINSGFGTQPQLIDLDGYSKGSPQAPITLVEFADFECAHCKTTTQTLDQLLKLHPRDLRLIYKHFPLEGHKMAKQASLAAEAAGLQGRFWPMHQLLFEASHLSSESFEAHAKKLGLNLNRFKQDLQSPKIQKRLEQNLEEGQLLGVEGTPSLFFNGRPFHLSTDLRGLELRLAMEKSRSESTCREKP
ncbi:MAG: thioredoxin domain-containing protein [Myxococcaceae bacterium]|nr:thioredoxin domain-containing protein [Myxococcaceae bacterium]MBH2006448.1 thioredoxin domain-containing protein [Myxococcaceae bacterium]